MPKIIQWNIRSLKQRLVSLSLLINSITPEIFCLQETKLEDANFEYNGNLYKAYHHINKSKKIAAGGTSIFIKRSIPQSEIHLNTTLQAKAVKVTLNKPITICSIYIAPDENFTKQQLIDLHSQLKPPFIILGDFNAHSPLWEKDRQESDIRAKIIEDFLIQSNSCLLNDLSPTHINATNLKKTSIDLTFCHPDIAPDFEWSVLNDLHDSDHFPITINSKIIQNTPLPRFYNLKKTDWTNFTRECEEKLNLNSKKTFNSFYDTLHTLVQKYIPKSSPKLKKNKSWFNKECSQAIEKKKVAQRKAITNPTIRNIIQYKIERAKSRKICQQAKTDSFKNYVSKINRNTPMNKVWSIVKKLKGTFKEPIKHVKKSNGSMAKTEKDIANTIGKSFSQNSSSSNYNDHFKRFKYQTEKSKINFSSSSQQDYNQNFTINEIKSCISELKNTAAGPDEIHNIIIQHLPEETIKLLLEIFNNIWQTHSFPDIWKKATIIPIPKPGKDHSDPSNYRPIALTSCLCKLMEKLVNKRLTWFLEINKYLTPYQSGFRKNRSTYDNLTRLETFIRQAFIRKEHVTVIFFDLEKAFDTTWKYGILKDLYDMGLKGNLPIFIQNFLKDRSFQVRVGQHMSDPFQQEEGVPQGSILSPVLFEIKINSIVNTLKNNVDG